MPARINRSGITYGSWKAIKPATINSVGRVTWQCVCVVCGVTKRAIAGDTLERGATKRSCGCDRAARVKIRKDLTGQTFGWLKVISRAPDRNGVVMWNCICSRSGCGKRKVITRSSLQQGQVSCGCYGAACILDRAKAAQKPEGIRANRFTFNSAHAAWMRCYKQKRDNFESYGGRGIRFASCWLRPDGKLNFAQFLADLGERPQGSELHRMHNDGPYAPWNCFWSNTKPHAETISSMLNQGEPTNQRLRAQLRILDVPIITTPRHRTGGGKGTI